MSNQLSSSKTTKGKHYAAQIILLRDWKKRISIQQTRSSLNSYNGDKSILLIIYLDHAFKRCEEEILFFSIMWTVSCTGFWGAVFVNAHMKLRFCYSINFFFFFFLVRLHLRDMSALKSSKVIGVMYPTIRDIFYWNYA